jgi:DNA-binding PadR family transcriptional regulator
MAKRRFANLLALAVLSCLSEKPMHPYEISQTLRHRGKDQSIKLNYGALYSVVESLAKAGLISARETVREGRRPERTVYAITDPGREEHEEWLAELLSTPTREYHSLEAGLALMAGLAPEEVTWLLRDRATKLRLDLGGVEAGLKVTQEMGLPQIFVVEEEFRRAMLTTELDYVTHLAEAIRNDELTGVTGWRTVQRLMAQGLTFEEIMRDPVGHLGEEAAVFADLDHDT